MTPARLVVVAGLSGSGKSTVLNRLEDLGYRVVHNLPSPLVDAWLAWARTEDPDGSLAVGLDCTGLAAVDSMDWFQAVGADDGSELIFLQARDEELLRRYSVTRRRHPGSDEEKTIKEALETEQNRMSPLKELASHCLDTTKMTASQLKEWVTHSFDRDPNRGLRLTLVSFGFKYGAPSWIDICADLRFLLNPYYDLDLRPLSGHDAPVYDYVLSLPEAQRWLDEFSESLIWQHRAFQERGKSHLSVGIGCTGGQHRSVSLALALAQRLSAQGIPVDLRHRDTPAPKAL